MLRAFLRLALLALALIALFPASAGAQQRPNVVLIVADDLGWGDVGAYGQTRIRTPRIDALAREGMRFTQAYAGAPVCAPSRCVLLTGLHGGHCPVGTNEFPNQTLRPDEVTVARLLRGAGYRTGIVGKWGLGGELPDGTAHQISATPWRMGFDEGLVVLDQTVAHDHWPEWVWVDGERFPLEGNVEEGRARYGPEVFTAEALGFLDRAARRDEPFFLYVAYTLPHREVVAESDAPYASEPWPAIERAFAAMVTRLDSDVGRLVDRVDELGLAERTLIVFASDNGPQETDGHLAAFFDSNGPLRGGKRDLYEGGIRVPMIARWPGTVSAGVVEERPVGFVDVLPTLTDLAELGAPFGIDGISLLPTLRGLDAGRGLHDALIWASREGAGSPGEQLQLYATRLGSLMLIERHDGSAELYDVEADVAQRVDLAAARPADVAMMRALRAAEHTGTPRLVDPILRVAGPDVISGRADTRRAAAPVLWLRFEGRRLTTEGTRVVRVESAVDAPALSAIPANGVQWDTSARAPFALGAPNARSVRLERAAHQYLTIPAHPSLAIGHESMTIEAWVRLASIGGRQWLVHAKPLGREDEFLDFGVLVQSSNLAAVGRIAHGPEALDGHELALVFGDPSLTEGPWVVASSLRIADLAWHRIAIRFDVERGRAIFDLDDAHEVIEVEDLGHLVSSGPVLIGAHHDSHGDINGTLDGWIDELRISRGVVADSRLLDVSSRRRAPMAEAVLDLGVVPLGASPIERVVRIDDGAPRQSRLLEGRVDARGVDDPRLTIDAPPFSGLASGAGHGEVRVTFRPSALGPLSEQSVSIEGYVAELGYRARGAPLRLRIVGRVVARTSMDAGVEGAPARALPPARACSIGAPVDLGASAALFVIVLIGLARTAARRARARSRASRPSAPTPGTRGTPSARTGTTRRGSPAVSRSPD